MGPSLKAPIEFILTCHCPDMPNFAAKAFSTIFPKKIHPIMLIGNKQILEEAEHYSGTPLGEFLKGIYKNKEKFAYYIKYDGKNVELWDLKKGIRIP